MGTRGLSELNRGYETVAIALTFFIMFAFYCRRSQFLPIKVHPRGNLIMLINMDYFTQNVKDDFSHLLMLAV